MGVEALSNMIYTHDIDYDIYREEENMEKAKVFTNGRSQAVRLPKEYRMSRSSQIRYLFPLSASSAM